MFIVQNHEIRTFFIILIYTCIIAKTTDLFMYIYIYESKPSYSPKSYIPHLKKQLQSPNTQSYDYTITLNHISSLSCDLKGVEIKRPKKLRNVGMKIVF